MSSNNTPLAFVCPQTNTQYGIHQNTKHSNNYVNHFKFQIMQVILNLPNHSDYYIKKHSLKNLLSK